MYALYEYENVNNCERPVASPGLLFQWVHPNYYRCRLGHSVWSSGRGPATSDFSSASSPQSLPTYMHHKYAVVCVLKHKIIFAYYCYSHAYYSLNFFLFVAHRYASPTASVTHHLLHAFVLMGIICRPPLRITYCIRYASPTACICIDGY